MKKRPYRTHVQRKPVEYGRDKTTPPLSTKEEIQQRVAELINQLKKAKAVEISC